MSEIIRRAALLTLFLMPVAAQASHWGYEGSESPEHWGQLNDEYKTCQQGMNQSPINIDNVLSTHLKPLQTDYSDGPSVIVNNGHTVQVSVDDKARDTVSIDGEQYQLQQFHFHAPSENTVHGKHFAMELHLVHKNSRGEIAVVAVMFDAGAPNPELNKLWQAIPARIDSSSSLSKTININKLIPADKTYWRFSGSLTTPPCSEGVTWIVMKHPMTLSAEQLKKFTQTMHHDNNRPTQPLHGRIIVE